jgi:ribosomal protein L11 methyltransferase
VNQKLYRHILKGFNIKDAFEATDLLFERGYMSVSCAETSDSWMVEVIDATPVSESEISKILRGYRFFGSETSELEDTDWLKKCFENLRPFNVGEFYIYGPHLRGQPIPADKIAIEIAAATAFGTGEHPSTNRCLMACQTFFDEKQHRFALDVGCGSGILSIALAKSGAERVDACDIDAEAVRVAGENAKINREAHRINVSRREGSEISGGKYDFIAANILAAPLIGMAEALVSAMSEEGILVISGFTSDDVSVLQKYLSSGLKLKFRYDLENWTTAVFCKKTCVAY